MKRLFVKTFFFNLKGGVTFFLLGNCNKLFSAFHVSFLSESVKNRYTAGKILNVILQQNYLRFDTLFFVKAPFCNKCVISFVLVMVAVNQYCPGIRQVNRQDECKEQCFRSCLQIGRLSSVPSSSLFGVPPTCS